MIKSLSGVRDVDLKILEELNDKDLFNFCLTSKYGRTLCNNEDFWRRRFLERFGKHEKRKDRTWKDFYLSLVYYLDKNKWVGKNIFNRAMHDAAKGGMKNIDLIEYFISQGAKEWNLGMFFAAQEGHRDLVDFFISKGANNWEMAKLFAEDGRQQDLVEFFRQKAT